MNIAELSIRKSTITWVLTILLAVVGYKSFNSLSRLEDPEFTIKDAMVFTPFPGASASEVEEEVTNLVEKAIQQLGQVDWIESRSARGMSQIKVHIKDRYDSARLPQVWDELRRKVGDVQRTLPPGAGPSIVNDDFGDVYGIFVAITGEGYDYQEIYEYAKFLQRELLSATDVKRIAFYGEQPERIYIEMKRGKMAELGISPQDIYGSLAAKNLPASAGNVSLGSEYLPVSPTGGFRSEKEFGDLLVSSRGMSSDRLVYLRDVAEVVRGYRDPPTKLLRYDKKPAIGLAVATVSGGNVITMGKALKRRFAELATQAPLGMDIEVISLQTEAVTQAISGFLVSLGQAVGIVVVVLLIFMGLRSGLIIGAILIITLLGTFIFMDFYAVTLERISLGALVIALGMLVDNAIVVTDGMRVKMSNGTDAMSAAREVVGQTGVPLLGATFIAILAFAAIGTSQDSTGEFCRTLFSVIGISLTLSWVTAVTSTPLLCKTFLKTATPRAGEAGKDAYGGGFYRLYASVLGAAIRFRWVTVGIVVALFVLSILGFGRVKKSFFPESTRPQFYVDFWFPEGTHIAETARRIERAEQYFLDQDGIENAISFIGGGQTRFLLTYTPESVYPSFAQVLVSVDDYRTIPERMERAQKELPELFPQAIVQSRAFVLGPSSGGKVQLRILGSDNAELRRLGNIASGILLDDPYSKGVRNEWREQVKVVRPQLAEAPARQAGITRPMLAQAFQTAVEGTTVGVFRDGDELLPIVARAPGEERVDFDNLGAVQVWSPAAQQMIPAAQVVTGFRTEFEDAHVWRRDRRKMLRIHADPSEGLPSELFARTKHRIEQALGVDVRQAIGRDVAPGEWGPGTIPVVNNGFMPLDKPGYYIAWGGEAEDSARAGAGLASTIPVFFGLMILLVILLFNSIKKTLIIWLCVPLALIGVTTGLLAFGQPFGFMAMLGLMSLAGMLIKNAIVLIDQIDLEQASGKAPYQAVLDSGLSRLIPVSMAALTTILGLVPLLADAFFIAMAVTIMFGLGFATVLTLLVVPVLYTIFFRVASPS